MPGHSLQGCHHVLHNRTESRGTFMILSKFLEKAHRYINCHFKMGVVGRGAGRQDD